MTRKEKLMPAGIPRYVRCYDNGGETADRYTVILTGRYTHKTGGVCWYLAMSAAPFHPQGIGQHGESDGPADAPKGWPPAVGRKCHLGRRIRFEDLPSDCRKAVLQTYVDLWDLKETK